MIFVTLIRPLRMQEEQYFGDHIFVRVIPMNQRGSECDDDYIERVKCKELIMRGGCGD